MVAKLGLVLIMLQTTRPSLEKGSRLNSQVAQPKTFTT